MAETEKRVPQCESCFNRDRGDGLAEPDVCLFSLPQFPYAMKCSRFSPADYVVSTD